MSIFLRIVAALFALWGVLAAFRLASDIRIIVMLLAFGFGAVILGQAAIVFRLDRGPPTPSQKARPSSEKAGGH
jgi:hypothetical protein